ncbi:MAG: FkbM family methyltransferase [Candidatus Omnitrophota bacterium]
MIKNFLKEIQGINIVDIGCSCNVAAKWKPVEKYLNVIGFDTNKEECDRMSKTPHSFLSAMYLPYTIAGDNSQAQLYKTKSIYCYSLLKPNLDWLRRFSFSDMFEIVGTEQVTTKTLDSIQEIDRIDVDVIKIDTQGLELPILSRAERVLAKTFFVETETGFLESYIGETTYAQICEFMHSHNYLLFDINNSNRIPRNNIFKGNLLGEQLMWCEATWLKDYIALYKQNKLNENKIGREKALKSLILCSLQGCISYGYELAMLFRELGLINSKELDQLKFKKNWLINSLKEENIAFLKRALRKLSATFKGCR